MSLRWKWRATACALWAAVCALSASGCASWQGPRIDPSGERFLIWPGQPAPTFTPAPPAVVAPPAPVIAAPGATAPPAPLVSAPYVPPPPPVGLPSGNLQAPPVYPDAGPTASPPPVITVPPSTAPPMGAPPTTPPLSAAPLIPPLDAQWAFPSSTVAQAGRPLVLTTIVTRRSDRAPLAGWTVRYSVSTPAAGAAGNGLVEIATDPTGRASLEVSPTSATNGTAVVNVAVVPPADAAGGATTEAARSTATITWNGGYYGPPPAVVAAPAVASPSFVSTPTLADGDIAATTGTWTPRQPAPFEPPPSLSSDAETPKTYSPPPATYSPPPKQEPAGKPELIVDVQRRGPATASVGGFASFEVVVTNRGDATARGIKVLDRFDAGLSHPKAVGDELAVKYESMRDLEPGESATVALTFGVRAAGELCHQVTVTADGAEPVIESGCVTAVAARPATPPSLEVTKRGPTRHYVGERAKFGIVIKNTGDAPVTNLEVIDSYDAAFDPRLTDAGREILPDGRFLWRIPRLEKGERREIKVECDCLTPTGSACSRVIVTADGDLNYADEKCVEILPAPGGAN